MSDDNWANEIARDLLEVLRQGQQVRLGHQAVLDEATIVPRTEELVSIAMERLVPVAARAIAAGDERQHGHRFAAPVPLGVRRRFIDDARELVSQDDRVVVRARRHEAGQVRTADPRPCNLDSRPPRRGSRVGPVGLHPERTFCTLLGP